MKQDRRKQSKPETDKDGDSITTDINTMYNQSGTKPNIPESGPFSRSGAAYTTGSTDDIGYMELEPEDKEKHSREGTENTE